MSVVIAIKKMEKYIWEPILSGRQEIVKVEKALDLGEALSILWS